jgi:hypothetical protein
MGRLTPILFMLIRCHLLGYSAEFEMRDVRLELSEVVDSINAFDGRKSSNPRPSDPDGELRRKSFSDVSKDLLGDLLRQRHDSQDENRRM